MNRRGAGETVLRTGRLDVVYPHRRDFDAWHRLRLASRATLEPFEPTWSHDAMSREDWARRLRRWRDQRRDGSGHVFLLRRRSDDVLVGGVALSNVRYGSVRSASLGYWLGTAFEGSGLMTEAVRGVCGWAFSVLALARIEAGTVPENEASQAVLKRVGFQEEGRARSYLEIAGKRRDHVLFGLVSGDLTG